MGSRHLRGGHHVGGVCTRSYTSVSRFYTLSTVPLDAFHDERELGDMRADMSYLRMCIRSQQSACCTCFGGCSRAGCPGCSLQSGFRVDISGGDRDRLSGTRLVPVVKSAGPEGDEATADERRWTVAMWADAEKADDLVAGVAVEAA